MKKLDKMKEQYNKKKFNNINAKQLAEKFLNQKPDRELIFQLINKITVSKDKEVNIYYKFNNN